MPGLVKSVYDFEVFKLAYAASLEIHRLSKAMSKGEQYGGIADQIRRASKSICANLAEGFGKNSSSAEFRRFVLMALGSAREVDLWLKYAHDLDEIKQIDTVRLREQYGRIARMLQGLAKPRVA
ncbi:MAG: four helix bundle protein [Proteobacteria bacterium]|nr:four helix bundle protein [Pseudomonadota bacterium]